MRLRLRRADTVWGRYALDLPQAILSVAWQDTPHSVPSVVAFP